MKKIDFEALLANPQAALLDLRLRAGLTQAQAATVIGVDRATFQRWGNPGAKVPASAITLLANLPEAGKPAPRRGPRVRRHTTQPLTPSAVLQLRRDEIRQIIEHHGASNPRVFGSVARGDDTPKSDLDILVDVPDNANLLFMSALQRAVESAAGISVDLLTEEDLSPRIRSRALAEAIPL